MADEESKQESESGKAPAKEKAPEKKTPEKKPSRRSKPRSTSKARASKSQDSKSQASKSQASKSKSSPKKSASEDSQPSSDPKGAEKGRSAAGYQDPFAGGAAALFEYAEQLEASGEDDEEQQREAREPWVCFDIADRRYGLPVQVVQEVLRVDSITRVPHAPQGIRGVTNMRGRVLPVVDLRLRLGFPEQQVAGASRILVALAAAGPVGLLVDAVEQMLAIAASEHQEPPAEMRQEEQSAALAMVDPGDQPLLLLDLERLLEPIAAASLARSVSSASGEDAPSAAGA